MNTPLPQIQQTPPPETSSVCRMLRTKTAFGTMSYEDEHWTDGQSTTAAYWCLNTMETAGPDDALAHPTSCRAGRACYAPDPD